MTKIIDSTNVGRLVSDIKAKTDAAYWPKSDTVEVSLATVATTGSYNDLTDKPTAATGALIYMGTCGTAAATATKVVTVETFPLQNGLPLVGTTIGVKFSNTNSASTPKLNVNGTGAQSIYYNSAEVTSTSSIYGGSANRHAYYVWDGTYWVWLNHGTESNDNTVGYTVRTNATRKTVSGACYRYRLLFTSADNKKWVPANTATSTNATSSRTVNQTKIDPWGAICYYGSTSALSSGSAPTASSLYQQYAPLTLGYSFNRTGAALVLTTQTPVYIKCAPQTDGSAIIDADNPYVQDLPTTEDGKIYIFLGVATSATQVEVVFHHPVYYFKDGAIRLWTNAAAGSNGPDVVDVDTASSTISAQVGTIYQWSVVPTDIALTLPSAPADVSKEIVLKFVTGANSPSITILGSVSLEDNVSPVPDPLCACEYRFIYDTVAGWLLSVNKYLLSELPAGYTAYNWIGKTSGTAYIDTGAVPTSKPRVEVELMFSGATIDADFFGCYPAIADANFIFNPGATNTDGFLPGIYYKYGSKTSGSIPNMPTLAPGYWRKIVADDAVILDGYLLPFSSSWNFSVNTGTFRVFGCRNSNCVNFKIRRLRLFDDDTLLRDLIPCTDPNSVAGMYDMVTGTFYASAVAGQTFTVGN